MHKNTFICAPPIFQYLLFTDLDRSGLKKSSFSTIFVISHIQLAQVSSDESLQGFHET
jgi:hypothetical protein